MSALSALEQALYNVAKASLPRYLFQEDASAQEVTAAFAKLFAPIWADLELRVNDTFLVQARTEALYQHARDRGTRPQENETDDALVYRLRYQREDSITVSAIKARALAILESYGVTVPAGYPGVVELRRDRGFMGRVAGSVLTLDGSAIDGLEFDVDGTTFEFDTGGGVGGGNTAITVLVGDTATEVAAKAVAQLLSTLGGSYSAQISNVNDALVLIANAGSFVSITSSDFDVRCAGAGMFFGNGYRMSGGGRAGTVFVVLLPYGTDAACAASVAEAMRQIKAGGVKVVVERRLSP